MKLGTMLSDIYTSLFRRPVTQRYPFERLEAPEHFRGKLVWNPETCNGCGVCTKDCPAKALDLLVLDKKNKRFVMRYHADRCAYCAQCVQSCRFKCLGMSDREWELAALTKEPFTVYYGNDVDVDSVLAQLVGSHAAEPAGAPAD